ncbi:MAG: HNH endonuclease signature motif containing protein [Candidatus Peregrinibacteria bacterium]
MTDSQKLHLEFVKLGMMKRKLTNRMLLILPEIYESRIYKKYASSIVEYAGKFGGISKTAVEKRLRLEKYLENKPVLKAAICEVGIHKVSLIATLATPETEEIFADKVKNMSKSAIQTLSKELRMKESLTNIEPCQAKAEKIVLELDEEMTFMFLKLKNELGKNLSNKELMRKILKSVTGHNLPRPEKVVTGDDSKVAAEVAAETAATTESRYIPAQTRRKVLKKSSGRCGYPGCNKPYEIFHHNERFAGNKSHKSLVAVCRNHHEFMHNGLVENEHNREFWALNFNKGTDEVDQLYRKYRQAV